MTLLFSAVMRAIYKRQRYSTEELLVSNSRYSAIIADTPTKRSIGLMFRDRLGNSECMLFKFDVPGSYGIWMLNMNFSIDIVWLDENKMVVDLVENAAPCRSFFRCKTYTPKGKAAYVVEFASGAIGKENIAKGSFMAFR